jgi:hypothetical protein
MSHLHYASGLRPGDVFPQEPPTSSPIVKHRKHFSENYSKNHRFQGQEMEPTFAKKTKVIGSYGSKDFKLYYLPTNTSSASSSITQPNEIFKVSLSFLF